MMTAAAAADGEAGEEEVRAALFVGGWGEGSSWVQGGRLARG